MAIELPSEVVSLLQFIGINWPDVNEDKVREFGQHVRDFAQNISGAHGDVTGTLQQLGQAYQGPAYDTLNAAWTKVFSQHMDDLVNGCHVVATALDVGADAIVGMKTAAIAELVALAASFVADQAAAVATFGLAEAAEAGIVAAAEKAVNYLEQQLTQYVTGQIIEAAITPLVGVVEKAVSGLVYSGTQAVTAAGGAGGSGFRIVPDDVAKHAQAFRDHAETVAGHAEDFTSKLSTLSFQ